MKSQFFMHSSAVLPSISFPSFPRGASSHAHPFLARPVLPLVSLRSIVAAAKPESAAPLPPLVKQLLKTPGLEAPEGSSPEEMLKVTEAFWKAIKNPKIASKPGPVVVTEALEPLPVSLTPEFDVCVAGGTLGIFLALALQLRGHRVCVVERRLLQGRTQEWNISAQELESLVVAGLVTQEELDACVETSWEADRIGFKNGGETWVRDVLNIGISPRRLISAMKARFLEAGGVLKEQTAFKTATVHENGVLVHLLPGTGALSLDPGDVNRPTAFVPSSASSSAHHEDGIVGSPNTTSPGISLHKQLTARLLIDCMGHYSPIVKQFRSGQQPDGMVVVVGGCFTSSNAATPAQNTSSTSPSFDNTSADLLYSLTDSFNDSQLFWEAFPAEGGAARTAYMFLYTDTHPDRPSFTSLLNTYLTLLPRYQKLDSLDEITFKRVLFGGFPCYMERSPLPPAFDRVLQVGDAAAVQSPLSFGGFGAMVRHLPRLLRGVDQALVEETLRKKDLGWLQPYQPSLSVSWLFQRSMSVKVGQLKEDCLQSSPNGEGVLQNYGYSSNNNNHDGRAVAAEVAGRLSALPSKAEEASVSGRKEENERKRTGWLPPDHVNRLLRCNFAVMRALGGKVLRPFVQDALQAGPLALTMLFMMVKDPIAVTRVLFQTGPLMIIHWFQHFLALLAASVLYAVLRPLRKFISNFTFQRLLDALEYGSASDYEYRASEMTHIDRSAAQQRQWQNNGGSNEDSGGVEEAREDTSPFPGSWSPAPA